jgi:putative endonuclease
MEKLYYLYLLHCRNDAYYTGITTDPARRWAQHQKGKAAKYTRAFPPLKMAGLWQISDTLNSALQIERHIKSLTRQEKIALINNPLQLKEWMIEWEKPHDLFKHCPIINSSLHSISKTSR